MSEVLGKNKDKIVIKTTHYPLCLFQILPLCIRECQENSGTIPTYWIHG